MKKIGTVAGASVAAFALGATIAGGLSIANADDAANTNSMRIGGMHRGHGPGPGELVTGEDAQKAIDAATAAVPGTADHVHKAPDGTYRVMVQTSDGKRVVVSLDADFNVTGQEEPPMRPGHGTPASEEETQKVTDAVLAQEPGATVHFVAKEDDGTFEAHFVTADGVRKEAHLDANFAITSVEDDHGPRGHGTPASDEQTQQVTDAVAERLPGATVLNVMVREDGGFAAMVSKANGAKRLVLLDSDYKIESIKKAPKHRGDRRGQDVTGPKYRKAAKAAKAEVKGTVMGVHKVGKKYFAMVRKANGNMVLVKMDKDFDVLKKKKVDFPGPRGHRGGPGGHGGMGPMEPPTATSANFASYV